MFDALIDSFQISWPMALGIALSPTPVLAVVVLLMTPQAKTSAPAFLTGWLMGILVVGTFIILLPGVVASHGGLSDTTGIVKTILGFALLITAIPIWIKRPKPGDPFKAPKIFQGIHNFGMRKSFIVGFLTSGLSIKIIALTASGAAHIDTTDLVDHTETLVGVFLFSLVASFTLILPIIVYFLSPKKMDQFNMKLKTWLMKHYTIILVTMLLIFGILLMYIGLRIYLT